MFRLFGLLLPLLFAAILGWPYFTLYQLDKALAVNNSARLQKLIDLPAVQAAHKQAFAHTMQHTLGGVGGTDNPLLGMLRQGMRAAGDMAVDYHVDMAWVHASLYPPQGRHASPGLLSALSFAFFESPTRFLVRLGELGEQPVHFYLTLQDWNWRVTAVYRSTL
jgi:hypothetical protein